MYRSHIHTSEQAMIHLFLHCCHKDGSISEKELKSIGSMMETIGLHPSPDLAAEASLYASYLPQLGDEVYYLQFLIDAIRPVNHLALFALCFELFLSDRKLAHTEEVMLSKLAHLLHIRPEECRTVQKLVLQLEEVKTNKTF